MYFPSHTKNSSLFSVNTWLHDPQKSPRKRTVYKPAEMKSFQTPHVAFDICLNEHLQSILARCVTTAPPPANHNNTKCLRLAGYTRALAPSSRPKTCWSTQGPSYPSVWDFLQRKPGWEVGRRTSRSSLDTRFEFDQGADLGDGSHSLACDNSKTAGSSNSHSRYKKLRVQEYFLTDKKKSFFKPKRNAPLLGCKAVHRPTLTTSGCSFPVADSPGPAGPQEVLAAEQGMGKAERARSQPCSAQLCFWLFLPSTRISSHVFQKANL